MSPWGYVWRREVGEVGAVRSRGVVVVSLKTFHFLAELGYIVERHLISIGLLKKAELDEAQKKLLEEKRAELEESSRQQDAFSKSEYPEGAQLCSRCNTAAVVMTIPHVESRTNATGPWSPRHP